MHQCTIQMLFHDNAETRLAAWRKMLLFYGATRSADTLTLSRLDRFIDAYDRTSAFSNHGTGPAKSRFEVVTNLEEVTAEYKRVMEERRAAGNEAMPEKAEPDAELGALSAEHVVDRFLGNNAVQFHPNDFEAKAKAKSGKS